MGELYDRGTGGGGSHGSGADASSETRPRPADDNGQESWAEDAEPLTRGEYDQQVRQREAAGDYDNSTGRNHDGHAAHEPDVAEDGQEQEELPEPRTRQEVAEEARSGTDPLAQGGKEVQEHERDAGDSPSPDERARLHETYLDWRNEIATVPDHGTGWEQGANIVGDRPSKSPGDRTDLSPTGEELLDMDSDKLSRFDKLREESYKEIEDILDGSEKYGGTIKDLFDRPPMEAHSEVPAGHPAIEQPAHEGIDGGHFVVAAMALGIVGYETARAIKGQMKGWKERRHDDYR